ncbi:MAG TPA: hypothetical protein VGW80_05460 [Solirubrobacterales bacterium]|jgi:hypothetical protein|nr:hypothetical protein [Solirubrobacterales bacterium]
MKTRITLPSPAMIVALIALVAALSGTAYAALGKNSVGTRQLKAKAVTAGKIANNAVTSAKVAKNSLTGADINVGALGTVPNADRAGSAGSADSVGGHTASCPGGTVLIRGVCFDAAANGEAPTLKSAADACASKGGFLPSPMELYSTRSVLNLGTGVGTSHMYTDSYYSAVGSGSNYTTVVVDGTGKVTELSVDAPSQYICAYALVR